MRQSGFYAIHYTLDGERHTDVLANLDVPVTRAVRELARRHLPLGRTLEAVSIADVSVQPLYEAERRQA